MKKRPINIRYKIPLLHHIIFWLGYFLFSILWQGLSFNDFSYAFRSNIIAFIFHIAIIYFNLYYLIPNYILTKKYLKYVLLLIAILFVFYLLNTSLFLSLLYTTAPVLDKQFIETSYSLPHIISSFMGEIYVISFVSLIKTTADWIYEKNHNEGLRVIQLHTELQFLKSQIQPHFFFNTLNNLYALTIEKSSRAPEVVLKLSEIMEYILYDAKEQKIRLLSEIKYIQNYIDLEKIRYGDKANVTLKLQGDIETPYVPPLLFLPFIENCFKHGTIENNKLNVLIQFKVSQSNLLQFKVTNNYNLFTKKITNHGIGNKNIRRRLELLYDKNFILTTKTKKQNYIVELTIPL